MSGPLLVAVALLVFGAGIFAGTHLAPPPYASSSPVENSSFWTRARVALVGAVMGSDEENKGSEFLVPREKEGDMLPSASSSAGPDPFLKSEEGEKDITGTGASSFSELRVADIASPRANGCAFSGETPALGPVFISEIAWMGGVARSGEPATRAAAREWLEIWNPTTATVPLGGWQLVDDRDRVRIRFAESDKIPSRGPFVLERDNDEAILEYVADGFFSGALPNNGVGLALFGNDCALIDRVEAGEGWFAGDNGNKKTMERESRDDEWRTSDEPGGTPGILPSTSSGESRALSGEGDGGSVIRGSLNTTVIVRIALDGDGRVVSVPKGIECGTTCRAEFAKGTKVKLSAQPASGQVFSGWTGICSERGSSCEFIADGHFDVAARFRYPGSTLVGGSSGNGGSVSVVSGGVRVSEVRVGSDYSADDEFVELYNSGSMPVDLTGWSLKKKSGTGNESSLVAASRLEGRTILPGKYFLLGNESGYQGTPPLDVAWPSSYKLAYENNAVLIYGSDGGVVEEVSWAEIPKNQSLVRKDWSGNDFEIAGSPTPRNSSE